VGALTNSTYKRVVVKVGTSVLTDGTRQLSPPRMVDLARQCAELQRRGYEVILCTSGAIAAGRERLGRIGPVYNTGPVYITGSAQETGERTLASGSSTVAEKQMLAAVGQSRLMLMWEQFFEIYGLNVGQILLTHSDIASRGRFLNAQDTLQTLLEHKIIPVINENDAVATDEIKVGDNDNLSALVAVLADADLLILLTDQPGLFTADPRKDAAAELITEVRVIDDQLRAAAGGSRTGLGVGGMVTKLEAAATARRAGTEVVIALGHEPNVLLRLVDAEMGNAQQLLSKDSCGSEPRALGTRFLALETTPENRKRWILAGVINSGRIVVDAGAAHALRYKGRSLLPAGIVAVEGAFDRGDTVSIIAQDSEDVLNGEIARGVVRYASEELARIKGQHSDLIADVLGYTYGAVAVHRNDLILL
jgi:glutamate 5-kinase